MKILEDGTLLIGDVHAGRVFKGGVPLEKRGKIEELFYEEFERSLNSPCKSYIQLGDLFDSSSPSLDTILRVYYIIMRASEARPDVDFYFIAGNHDLSKDSSKTSGIEILRKLCFKFKNVEFVTQTPLMVDGYKQLEPWNYDTDYKLTILPQTKILLGHFEEPINPTILASGVECYSGHIHKAHKNQNVEFIGSILPVAFGEQSDDALCVEVVDLSKIYDMHLTNKRVRVHLKEGEVLPTNIDCLQLIGKKVAVDGVVDETTKLEVDMESFDFKELFFECLKESGKGDLLWSKYLNLKNQK